MPYSSGALVMSEGTPHFTEQRGIFILTIPIGEGFVRFGFLPHDFLQACHDATALCDKFFADNRIQSIKTG